VVVVVVMVMMIQGSIYSYIPTCSLICILVIFVPHWASQNSTMKISPMPF